MEENIIQEISTVDYSSYLDYISMNVYSINESLKLMIVLMTLILIGVICHYAYKFFKMFF